jgi:hypothetical protein
MNATSSPIFALDRPNDVVTSVACNRHNSLIDIVTTSQMLWLDERYAKRPVLAYEHEREYDRTLQASVVRVDDGILLLKLSLNTR